MACTTGTCEQDLYSALSCRHLRLGYHNRSHNSMCRARLVLFTRQTALSDYKQIDPAMFQNRQSAEFTSKECHLMSSTDSTKRHACSEDVQEPTFGGVNEFSHQASQPETKLMMAQARPSNQRLSRSGSRGVEVLHPRRMFGRQHFEGMVVITRKSHLDVVIIANQVRVRASTTHSYVLHEWCSEPPR